MKYVLLITISFCIMSVHAMAQKYMTQSGSIEIYSETPLFAIKGINNKVACILDTSNGNMVVSLLVRSFEFKSALVEERFNNIYLESGSYPKSVFKGKIVNYRDIDFGVDGTYDAFIDGLLTIHGITHEIRNKASITIIDGELKSDAAFSVSLTDYQIKTEPKYINAINGDILLKINLNLIKY